jgi:Ca2+-binding EF-hand superfamily protein
MRATLLILFTVALPVVAAESLGPTDPAAFEQRFKSADKDRDGKLTRKEAYEAFPRMPEFFSEIDRNRDESITLEEVRRAMEKRVDAAIDASKASSLEQRFRAADKDGDGKLTRKEAYNAFPRMPEHFDAIDRNRDEAITLEEVRRLEAKRIDAALDAGRASARFNRGNEPKEFTSRVEERRYYQSQFYESLLSDKNRARSRGEPVSDAPVTPILKGTF